MLCHQLASCDILCSIDPTFMPLISLFALMDIANTTIMKRYGDMNLFMRKVTKTWIGERSPSEEGTSLDLFEFSLLGRMEIFFIKARLFFFISKNRVLSYV